MPSVKVALVVPNSPLPLSDVCAPLNLGYLASYLRKYIPDVEVKIFDGIAGQNVFQELTQFRPDIVGITATTPQAPDAYSLADRLRHEQPGVFIVMGGAHPSAMTVEASQHCDCVVIEEGEKALVDIVTKRMANQPIPQVIQGEPIENLDDIPSPAFDLINMREYLKHGPSFPNLKAPIMSMVTSRGCPFRCPFCRNSGRRSAVRYFSAQRILDEILFFRREYGINSVFFNDDEFLINKKRLAKLAELFQQHGVDKWLVWGCQSRANTVDKHTLQLAKSAGCVVVFCGFESPIPRILKYLKCGTTTVEANERALHTAAEVGLTMGGSFIFGVPTMTLQEMTETMRWWEKTEDLKYFGINTLIPYPGAEVWSYCHRHSLLPKEVDYRRLVPTNVPLNTYIVNRALPEKFYNRVVVDFSRVAWVISQTRLQPGFKQFLKLSRFKTWWWMWFAHPWKMLGLMLH
ncbi:MAG: radical SAM protein [Candidatus Bathyarchaeia archaeon]